jgi:hypothetical protein
MKSHPLRVAHDFPRRINELHRKSPNCAYRKLSPLTVIQDHFTWFEVAMHQSSGSLAGRPAVARASWGAYYVAEELVAWLIEEFGPVAVLNLIRSPQQWLRGVTRRR